MRASDMSSFRCVALRFHRGIGSGSFRLYIKTLQKRFLTISTLALSLSFALAQSTVNFSSGFNQPDVYWDGAPVASGNQVRIGFFDSSFDVSSHLYDLPALGYAWYQFGFTTNRTLLGQPGHFAATASLFDPTRDVYHGQRIWMWLLKTSDNGLPTADFSNVIGYGLYSSSLANWVFPAYGATPPANTTSIDSSQINTSLFGTYNANHLFLAPVPEPPVTGFMALGISLFLLAFQKRNHTA